jgi:hypothetical protein
MDIFTPSKCFAYLPHHTPTRVALPEAPPERVPLAEMAENARTPQAISGKIQRWMLSWPCCGFQSNAGPRHCAPLSVKVRASPPQYHLPKLYIPLLKIYKVNRSLVAARLSEVLNLLASHNPTHFKLLLATIPVTVAHRRAASAQVKIFPHPTRAASPFPTSP